MTPESFVKALDHLDPGSRALLDLSLHRGMEDREIAELLGSDPDYVSSSREAAIAQLAEDLGLHGDGEEVRGALAEMGEEAWRPRVLDDDEGEADHPAEAEPAEAAPERPKGSQRRLTLLVLLVVAAVAAVVIASGGGSKSTEQKPAAQTPPAANKPAPAQKPASASSARLTPLSAASDAKGTARLAGRKLSMTVSGLPQPTGSYEVWLYNDQLDAVPVTSFRSGSSTLSANLPVSPSGYRYLDVSLEPADGNPNHSGQSVLRVPLRSLP